MRTAGSHRSGGVNVSRLSSDAYRRDMLIEHVGEARSVKALFAEASRRLRRLVQFDAALWLATDPATALPSAPTLTENFVNRSVDCLGYWEREFLVDDANLYRDLARSDRPAAALRITTSDRPARSARYREFMRPNGFDDELRAVMRVDGRSWAQVGLFREKGRAPFAAEETELVASMSAPLAAAVRDHARRVSPPLADGATPGPGLMLFAPTGELMSTNDEARAWMEELAWLDQWRPASADTTAPAGLPLVVASTLMHARAIAEEREHGTARARVRSSTGRWLVCHASCLRDASGEFGSTALVIEPAKASEIAPIIVQAYELSVREQEITEYIAQGFSTTEIADRLHLSRYTVRDHVKAIFEKVGVSSRGELVAKLYVEHYAPSQLDPSNIEVIY